MNERVEIFQLEMGKKERLDIFLTASLSGFSRSRLQALIKEGCVTVDDMVVNKTGFMLEGGHPVKVRIPPPVPSTLIPENIPLTIIFENKDLMIINKPAGMVVHPSPGHESGTLVHAALGHAPDLKGIGGEIRPGIVHRLDRDTSGIIVIAKNETAHHWLQEQFKSRKVEKTYLALVEGKPPTPTGRVEAPIGRNSTHRKLMAVVPIEKGREAVSEYHTVESLPAHTLLEVHPLTGRTHQIRVHMAFLGCPVAGDRVYGRKHSSIEMDRQFLHAYRLKITLPGEKQPRLFEAEIPPDMVSTLNRLRKLPVS